MTTTSPTIQKVYRINSEARLIAKQVYSGEFDNADKTTQRILICHYENIIAMLEGRKE